MSYKIFQVRARVRNKDDVRFDSMMRETKYEFEDENWAKQWCNDMNDNINGDWFDVIPFNNKGKENE